MKKIAFIFFSFFFIMQACYADELALHAKSAILIDYDSGKVLYEKNANERLAPASMTKIMSMLLIMEKIDDGVLTLEDDVVISKNAADMGGSQVYLKEGETYKVKELLKGIAVASGNDAVVALAEKIGGNVANFVIMMNNKVKQLGLLNTNFINPHGLDAEGHYSSSYDMAIIAKELLKHPEILNYTSIYEDYLVRNNGDKTWLVNTNKLVRYYTGADGLKTGYTKNALYCLTATAKRNNTRFISVVMGEESTNNRSEDTINMLDYAFNTYRTKLIVKKEDIISRVKISKAKEQYVDIVPLDNISVLQKILDGDSAFTYDVQINDLKAPLKYGDEVGVAKVYDADGNLVIDFKLTVATNVVKANFFDYLLINLQNLFV